MLQYIELISLTKRMMTAAASAALLMGLPVSSCAQGPSDEKTILAVRPVVYYGGQTYLHSEMSDVLRDIIDAKYGDTSEILYIDEDIAAPVRQADYVVDIAVHDVEMRQGVKGLFLKKYKSAIVPVEICIQNAYTGQDVYHETLVVRADQTTPVGGLYGLLFGLSDKNTIAKALEKLEKVMPEVLPDLPDIS